MEYIQNLDLDLHRSSYSYHNLNLQTSFSILDIPTVHSYIPNHRPATSQTRTFNFNLGSTSNRLGLISDLKSDQFICDFDLDLYPNISNKFELFELDTLYQTLIQVDTFTLNIGIVFIQLILLLIVNQFLNLFDPKECRHLDT